MNLFRLALLGLETAQAVKMHQAEKQLELLNAGQLQAAIRNELLKFLREITFSTAQTLQQFEANIETYPQAVFVATTVMDSQLQQLGLSPQLFDDFNDKDYVAKTLTQTKDTINRARSSMNEVQSQEAEKAQTYIQDIALLNDMIEAEEAREFLQNTEAELADYQSSVTRNRLIGAVLVIFGLASCGLFPMMSLGNDSLVTCFPMIGILAGIAGIVLFTRVNTVDIKALEEQRIQARQKSATLQTSSLRWRDGVTRFGKGKSQNYKRLRTERQSFLEAMIAPLAHLQVTPHVPQRSLSTPPPTPSPIYSSLPASTTSGDRIICGTCGHSNSKIRTTCKKCRQPL